MAQSRQDAAPTENALLSWERHLAAISQNKHLLRRLRQRPNNPERTAQIRPAKQIQMIQHVIELV